ncbi:methyltransferase [Pseudoalteromonas denitrificans]|uniref:Dimerisation domain-containing protein n=1 Tax=Pseudoalteromonas denitrificans DSM 6059 TaxID=1123010 RepID=A0A1I1G880_9GAMM|nr:methyltransferase [Pseudoalteromonas denitrificans]SFC05553.1 Dimerisation domain-containing protein [Pseudoalteromonas denitrificans DSM 6059]
MSKTMEQTVDHMMGFFKTKTITAALDLKIFDYFNDQAQTVESLATKSLLPPAALERLLIALVAMEYLKKDGENYILPQEHKDFLVSDKPQWLGWLGRHIDTFLYPLWSNLSSGIQQDSHQRVAAFGDNRSWFDMLYHNLDDVADFQEFLGKFAQPFIDGFTSEYDFSKHKRFLDIGSGIGTLPIAVADKFTDIELAICELPQAKSFLLDKLGEQGYGNRIDVIEGNVITGELPDIEYDLVHLGWMLHDYSHETQMVILNNIFQAMPVGGRFIASETPLNDDNTGPEFTSLLSLNMLVSTDGGIESDIKTYIKRFEDAGFSNVRILDIPGPRTLFVGEKI